MRVSLAGLVRARWTDAILDECFAAILKTRPSMNVVALKRTRLLMNKAVLDCQVTDYESLIPNLNLPDPGDRHVLAAALRCKAQFIVTFNLKDFPKEALNPFGLEALDPDSYMLKLIELAPIRMASVISEQAEDLRNPPISIGELLETLKQQGLTQSVAQLRGLLSYKEQR